MANQFQWSEGVREEICEESGERRENFFVKADGYIWGGIRYVGKQNIPSSHLSCSESKTFIFQFPFLPPPLLLEEWRKRMHQYGKVVVVQVSD